MKDQSVKKLEDFQVGFSLLMDAHCSLRGITVDLIEWDANLKQ